MITTAELQAENHELKMQLADKRREFWKVREILEKTTQALDGATWIIERVVSGEDTPEWTRRYANRGFCERTLRDAKKVLSEI